jgi:hypothetical protein
MQNPYLTTHQLISWIDICGDNLSTQNVEAMGSKHSALRTELKREFRDHDSDTKYLALMQGVSFTA